MSGSDQQVRFSEELLVISRVGVKEAILQPMLKNDFTRAGLICEVAIACGEPIEKLEAQLRLSAMLITKLVGTDSPEDYQRAESLLDEVISSEDTFMKMQAKWAIASMLLTNQTGTGCPEDYQRAEKLLDEVVGSGDTLMKMQAKLTIASMLLTNQTGTGCPEDYQRAERLFADVIKCRYQPLKAEAQLATADMIVQGQLGKPKAADYQRAIELLRNTIRIWDKSAYTSRAVDRLPAREVDQMVVLRLGELDFGEHYMRTKAQILLAKLLSSQRKNRSTVVHSLIVKLLNRASRSQDAELRIDAQFTLAQQLLAWNGLSASPQVCKKVEHLLYEASSSNRVYVRSRAKFTQAILLCMKGQQEGVEQLIMEAYTIADEGLKELIELYCESTQLDCDNVRARDIANLRDVEMKECFQLIRSYPLVISSDQVERQQGMLLLDEFCRSENLQTRYVALLTKSYSGSESSGCYEELSRTLAAMDRSSNSYLKICAGYSRATLTLDGIINFGDDRQVIRWLSATEGSIDESMRITAQKYGTELFRRHKISRGPMGYSEAEPFLNQLIASKDEVARGLGQTLKAEMLMYGQVGTGSPKDHWEAESLLDASKGCRDANVRAWSDFLHGEMFIGHQRPREDDTYEESEAAFRNFTTDDNPTLAMRAGSNLVKLLLGKEERVMEDDQEIGGLLGTLLEAKNKTTKHWAAGTLGQLVIARRVGGADADTRLLKQCLRSAERSGNEFASWQLERLANRKTASLDARRRAESCFSAASLVFAMSGNRDMQALHLIEATEKLISGGGPEEYEEINRLLAEARQLGNANLIECADDAAGKLAEAQALRLRTTPPSYPLPDFADNTALENVSLVEARLIGPFQDHFGE